MWDWQYSIEYSRIWSECEEYSSNIVSPTKHYYGSEWCYVHIGAIHSFIHLVG